jgi:hypothetical protein
MTHQLEITMSNTSVDWIEVADVVPEQKDHDRAEGMKFRKGTFHGDNSPFKSNASKMAKAIEDPIKLVRRSKAVAQMYGTGIRRPPTVRPTSGQAQHQSPTQGSSTLLLAMAIRLGGIHD